jgi:hypothetical protein
MKDEIIDNIISKDKDIIIKYKDIDLNKSDSIIIDLNEKCFNSDEYLNIRLNMDVKN